ncbi:hypothetical protein GCM10023321_27870 [Pseudonocardia eucalypti]|uniref:Secreted protein n=1 Tax=Pseudonocardia eucalypti TaxID=648755 RepID=A0ABP9Q2T5_9PSEU
MLPVERLRALPVAEQNTPGRLLRLGALLVAGCLVTAVVSLFGGLSRQAAVDEATGRVAALSSDAAVVYRSLAAADAMATSGFVSGGAEPVAVRQRSDDELARASAALAHAGGELAEDDPARALVADVATRLPVYSGLIETARVYNRQGLPLGQTYLTGASALLRQDMLPAVQRLRDDQSAQLAEDYGWGRAVPLAVLLLGVATLAALGDAWRREARRTNRTVNPGLAASAGLVSLALLWWLVAGTVSFLALGSAGAHGRAEAALGSARVAVLQARSNESLVLVARSGSGASDSGFTDRLNLLLSETGLLRKAQDAVGPEADAQLAGVRADATAWQAAHAQLRALDDGGRYAEAAQSAIGTDPAGSRAAFDRLDASLGAALDRQREAQVDAAGTAHGALFGLAAGPMLLLLLAGVAAGYGIELRVKEYR